MNACLHSVVGLIDLPTGASWSPDSLVRSWLATGPSGSRDGVTPPCGRLAASASPEELEADLEQIQTDLNDLLESFLAAQ